MKIASLPAHHICRKNFFKLGSGKKYWTDEKWEVSWYFNCSIYLLKAQKTMYGKTKYNIF